MEKEWNETKDVLGKALVEVNIFAKLDIQEQVIQGIMYIIFKEIPNFIEIMTAQSSDMTEYE